MKKAMIFVFLGLTLNALAQDTYTLSPESTLKIDGSSTIHDWTVTANTLAGTLKATTATLNEISFEVPVDDIISERGAAMDKKMHEALRKEEHPKVIFSLKDVSNLGGENQTLSGMLNIAGVEKEVEIDTKVVQANGKLQLSGAKELKLADFNMEPPTAMFGSIVVGEDIKVIFDLSFVKE